MVCGLWSRAIRVVKQRIVYPQRSSVLNRSHVDVPSPDTGERPDCSLDRTRFPERVPKNTFIGPTCAANCTRFQAPPGNAPILKLRLRCGRNLLMPHRRSGGYASLARVGVGVHQKTAFACSLSSSHCKAAPLAKPCRPEVHRRSCSGARNLRRTKCTGPNGQAQGYGLSGQDGQRAASPEREAAL